MPQMMPMNWMILFIYFIMIYLISMNMFYYNYKINFKKLNYFKKKNNLTWKW